MARDQRAFCYRLFYSLALVVALAFSAAAQAPSAKAALGSETAKNGFRNEDTIRDKFNRWRDDAEARAWLASMNYRLDEVENVIAAKPHGAKADVEVRVKTRTGEKKEGISIKLVSSPTGFNQIDKRWLATYAKMWKMPADVHAALRLFVGEDPPKKPGRDAKRMYLNEMDPATQQAVLDFFTANKEAIVSDLFEGDGAHAAGWMMVVYKPADVSRSVIRSSSDALRYFAEGKVEITRAGNLKIGRITMQRKGGDGGRETAKMLQFKINPAQLFGAK